MKSLINLLKKLFNNSFMIRSIVVRDLRKRYIGSVMGFFWAFIHPIVLTVIYSVIFSVVFSRRIEGADGSIVPWAVFFLAGLLPWLLFSDTLKRAATIILENAGIITKSVFPSEILPITAFLTNLITHFIGMIVFAGLMLITKTAPDIEAFTLPIYIAVLFFFTVGLGWISAALNVFLRDIGQLIDVAIRLWFFASPLIYPASQLPDTVSPWGITIPFKLLFKLNPIYFIAEGYRNALIANYENNVLADWPYLLYIVGVSLFIFFIGGFIFKKLKWHFADVL